MHAFFAAFMARCVGLCDGGEHGLDDAALFYYDSEFGLNDGARIVLCCGTPGFEDKLSLDLYCGEPGFVQAASRILSVICDWFFCRYALMLAHYIRLIVCRR